ncbi:MAG: UDP-3-O-acyl-N-acetylglucosamine deacetylase [Pseudomonadota bacterium]
MQHTLKNIVSISGIGLHSGKTTKVVLHPAKEDYGIVFQRTDLAQAAPIPASWKNIIDTRLCTVIGYDSENRVATIEHIMAALRALGIDNVHIEIDGQEVPILDGSSKIFIEHFEAAGLSKQARPRKVIHVLKPISYEEDGKSVSLKPSAIPVYRGEIVYESAAIGTQRFELKLVNGNFKHDVSDCRTFCLLEDVEMMRQNGLALGGSLDNAIVIDDNTVLNEEGLRCHDEFIRHKILDAVGDLALSGGLILGAYEGIRAGHDMNYKLLKTLFANEDAWEYIDLHIDFESSDEDVYTMADIKRQSAHV